jgi:hypothetical protein
VREDGVDIESHEIERQSRQPVVVVLRPPVFEADVLALHVATLAEGLAEGENERAVRVLR